MAVFLQSLSTLETDLNSPRQERMPALPRAVQGKRRSRQAAVGRAACGTGRGQAHGKGTKG